MLAFADTAHADLRFTIRNDTLTELVPPMDDLGFTNDLELAFWRPYRGFVIGGRVFDRLVTETADQFGPGERRQDLLELVGTIEKTWGVIDLHSVTLTGRAGPVVTGNWGGRWYQNAFHTVCHCGTLLEEGLAHRYPEGRAYGALIGARVVASEGGEHAQAYSAIDGQASLGTGVTWVDAAMGGRLRTRVNGVALGLHAEIAAMRFHVESDALAIPGGYRPGWQLGWRIGAHVAWGRVRVEYEYRANEGGSGEPIGALSITVKQ